MDDPLTNATQIPSSDWGFSQTVFLSYAAADKAVALDLCQRLEARGLQCWIAPRDIIPGADYGASIIHAIERASTIVLLFSAHADASVHVRHEIERAVSKGKVVIPVRLENRSPGPSLELHLSSAHWLDAWNLSIEDLASRLLSILRPEAIRPDSTAPTESLTPGTAILKSDHLLIGDDTQYPIEFGDYRLLRKLGAGGMGTVYLGEQKHLHRQDAIKILSREQAQQPGFVERFFREMRAAGALRHPNIVQAHHAGEIRGLYFIAMEYLQGEDLESLLKRQQQLPLETACGLIHQAAEALDFAHAKGVVHRDVKPANLFLTTDGQLKLLDLGLARPVHREEIDLQLTTAHEAMGTPDYMAPEQWTDAREADARADIYSLGCTLFTLIAGSTPFSKCKSLGHKAMAHQTMPAPDLRALRAETPEPIARLIAQCLEKVPENRPATAREVATALEPYLSDHSVSRCDSAETPTIVSRPRLVFAGALTISFVLVLLSVFWRGKPDLKPPEPHPAPLLGDMRDDNGLKLRLAWCPAGTFTMGSPADEKGRSDDEDQVPVTFSTGFWIGVTEVTQGHWRSVLKTAPWEADKSVIEGSAQPAVMVSHTGEKDGAGGFCRKLTDQERQAGRLTSGWHYRLPTEAEWEYACRAGTKTAYGFGEDPSALGQHAWFADLALPPNTRHAHPAMTKQPNAWGIFDMHGNVAEWCMDSYANQRQGGKDPFVFAANPERVTRGGCWNSPATRCRSAFRYSEVPATRSNELGFRVVLSPFDPERY